VARKVRRRITQEEMRTAAVNNFIERPESTMAGTCNAVVARTQQLD